MLRIFEAIKKSPFLNGNYPFCPLPKNASAEIRLTHNLFQNVIPQPSATSADWNLYNFFIAWKGHHLLLQHRFSLASKHTFLPPFAAKRVAPKPLGESFLGA